MATAAALFPTLTGGAGGAAGPSSSRNTGGGYGGMFDASGWTVSTGGSKSVGGTSGGAASIPWTTLFIGAAVLLVLWQKFSK